MRRRIHPLALACALALPPSLLLGLAWRIQPARPSGASTVVALAGVGTDPVGACCAIRAAVTCFEGPASECHAAGGVFLGPDAVCLGHEPCCLADGSCLFVDRACCLDLGGDPQGPDTDCIFITCTAPVEGACCFDIDDGPLPYDTCTILTEERCIAGGGVFEGPDSLCTSEACCLPGGFCQGTDPECCLASGGVPLGPETACADADCLGEGACCLDVDDGPLAFDTCIVTDAFSCDVGGGTFQGIGSTCRLEACCLPTGYCQDADPACCIASQGCPQGPGTTCAITGCPCPGDTDGDDRTDIDDIVNVILCWGTSGIDCPNPGDRSDVNCDGTVDIDDVVRVVLSFGNCIDGD